MKTALITGSSSGFGKATAQLFLDKGWSVIATMRQPQDGLFSASSNNLRVIALDVTVAESVRAAVGEAIRAFGGVDVLVNNAGFGVFLPLETTPDALTRHVFETNTLGTIAMVHAFVPHMRERGSGAIVAVRSALEDVDRAYFVFPIRPGLVQATAQFAQGAIEAGVEAIVSMSQVSARRDAASHSAREHWLAEQVFNWSGLNVAHIRPTYFAEWLLHLAPIRQGVMYAPFTTGRHAPIAGEDQGRVIVGILENPEPHRSQAYPLYGPVELTHHEIAGIVGKVLGRAISYQWLPIEQWAELVAGASASRPPRNDAASLYAEADRITGRPGSEFVVQHLREVAIDHTNGVFAGTNDLVEKIGGRPPMTVEAVVAKHRAAFA